MSRIEHLLFIKLIIRIMEDLEALEHLTQINHLNFEDYNALRNEFIDTTQTTADRIDFEQEGPDDSDPFTGDETL